MSVELPTIQKAQPIPVPKELAVSCICGKHKWANYAGCDIERERAGYEKREQTLKNKIKELSIRLTSTTINAVKESNMPDAMTCGKLYKIADELLGLSKQ